VQVNWIGSNAATRANAWGAAWLPVAASTEPKKANPNTGPNADLVADLIADLMENNPNRLSCAMMASLS
jgi:hypothetical protein